MEEEMSKAVSITDPIDAVFKLNDEMLKRISRFKFIFVYTLLFGGAVAILSLIASLILLYDYTFDPFEPLFTIQIMLLIILIISIVAVYYAKKELSFLYEYNIFARSIVRAKNFQPKPDIPIADDPVERIIKYLESQDDRFALLCGKNPEKLKKHVQLQGKSKAIHDFDAFFIGFPHRMTISMEGITILIRKIPKVTLDSIISLEQAANDVLSKGINRVRIYNSVRVILIQTDFADFSDDVIEYVNNNWVKYRRFTGHGTYDWSSPIELIAEDPSGVYNFGSLYFG